MDRTVLSLPPRVKVLEALGAVAGGRVTEVAENGCRVAASEGDRVYTVRVDLNTGEASSDDNGTVFRNYVGYPIIAYLMVRGVLPYDERIAEPLKDVRWRTLNERLKSYRLVEREIAGLLKSRGVEWSEVSAFTDEVMRRLGGLQLWKRS
ncbi:MAG: hypothetical protein NZ953_00950 [Thaumarchaeota archaeon]|nr:hypothetical protein [Candidatus Calditenuaceae archaeon]MCX8203773.1 hypothetical protein [Nitrososphaeria archaeon]MDW8043071.1 hypothetical protein [Nitrososphaerota archaeon]